MPLPPKPRLVIPHHARQSQAVTGATWGTSDDAVRIGIVDRHAERDIRMPSAAVAPHLSLVLLAEGQGHFLMGDSTRPCEFLAGHCFLSCGWAPFDGEDFIPASSRFRAVLLHYPLALREVLGRATPVSQRDCEVHAHPRARAWLARLPMAPWMAAFAQRLIAAGLPTEPLALLELQCHALRALHGVASRLSPSTRELFFADPQPEPATATAAPTPSFSGRDRRRLLEARRHIEAHLAEPLTVSAIAAACGLSETALKKGFRALFGRSVYEHVLQARCARAADLLRDSPLTVRQVAEHCGFSSASHLAKHFAQRFSATPLRYRSLHS